MYSVHVNNIGTVIETESFLKAVDTAQAYCTLPGRAEFPITIFDETTDDVMYYINKETLKEQFEEILDILDYTISDETLVVKSDILKLLEEYDKENTMKYFILDETFASGMEEVDHPIVIESPTLDEAIRIWQERRGIKDEEEDMIITNEGNMYKLGGVREISEQEFDILKHYVSRIWR